LKEGGGIGERKVSKSSASSDYRSKREGTFMGIGGAKKRGKTKFEYSRHGGGNSCARGSGVGRGWRVVNV